VPFRKQAGWKKLWEKRRSGWYIPQAFLGVPMRRQWTVCGSAEVEVAVVAHNDVERTA